jgi:hypothetical protein
MPPDAPASLRRAQREFADRLCAALGDDAPAPTFQAPPCVALGRRLDVYRNNTRQFFRGALALTYPVLLRRVGEEPFRQLAHAYREAHPSTRGDLHWVGAEFPAWLERRLAGTGYTWLADLARLEWACEEAAAAECLPALELAALQRVAADAGDALGFEFQPSLRIVASGYPIWSVWQANQGEAEPVPVDLEAGGECCAVAGTGDGIAVHRLDAADHALFAALLQGATLGAVVDAVGADAAALTRVLQWAFAEGLVVGMKTSTAGR